MNEVRKILFGDASNSEIKRLIKQGAVTIDGEKIETIDTNLEIHTEFIMRCGKRKAVSLKAWRDLSIKDILGFNQTKIRDVSDEVCNGPK